MVVSDPGIPAAPAPAEAQPASVTDGEAVQPSHDGSPAAPVAAAVTDPDDPFPQLAIRRRTDL